MVLAIYGAGGNGTVVAEIAIDVNQKERRWDKILFVDDVTAAESVIGLEVVSFERFRATYAPEDEVEFVISVGAPENRKLLYDRVREAGYRFTTLVHPRAVLSPEVTLSEGVIVGESLIAATTSIGDNTLISVNCVIGHDLSIGKHCVISPGVFIGGFTNVADMAYIGPHSALKDRISVGFGSVVAMASAVFKDVPENCMAFGNPARSVRRGEKDKLF